MAYDSAKLDEGMLNLESQYKKLSGKQLAERAVEIATLQIIASTEYKKPRLTRIEKFWRLYDGKVEKKARQLFNVPIPIFPGMIDTLNAQYETPITLTFREGSAEDYFKTLKINGAWQKEVMNTTQNSKWDSKLRMARKHCIIDGRGILEYTAASDPEYYSALEVVRLKNFNFQPKGGGSLENHLFAGVEDVQKTESQLLQGARSGVYDLDQVRELLKRSAQSDFLPLQDNVSSNEKLGRFKSLGLSPDDHSYVGTRVYQLTNHIVEINGTRYYVCFNPWTKVWVRFEKWRDITSSDLLPWVSFASHEDDENFLSKSYGDDLYPAADAIVAMFNQELTNREKRNSGPRAYDKDMFPDVAKLDQAMYRPDALVPADTKSGTRRISEGIYEFKVGELGGTVNLIDWVSGTLGRNTGATDLAMGGVQDVSKKASVTFAEQKSVSKRIGWGSQSFQDMMSDLGKRYIVGLKDHMPARMAIRVMGAGGWDWDEITRLDLDTTRDVDVLIVARDQQIQDSEMKAKRRAEALNLLLNSPHINGQKRDEEILRSVGDYSDEEVAEFLDTQTYSDRKALARAAESIQMILRNQEPPLWYGANTAFIQKIVDFANDRRSTLKGKFETLINYAMEHREIAKENIARKVHEQQLTAERQSALSAPPESESENPGMSGGASRALSMAEGAV